MGESSRLKSSWMGLDVVACHIYLQQRGRQSSWHTQVRHCQYRSGREAGVEL